MRGFTQNRQIVGRQKSKDVGENKDGHCRRCHQNIQKAIDK